MLWRLPNCIVNDGQVETLFQIVTDNFEGEIQTLGYPPAVVFSFCMALVAYNLLATVKVALRVAHGAGKWRLACLGIIWLKRYKPLTGG